VIVIFSFATDLHARAVRRELVRAGQRVEILDLAALGAGDHLTFREGDRMEAIWTRATGEQIDLCAAHAIWHRRIATPQVPECATENERGFAIAQWNTLLLGILEALPVRMINSPLADRFLEKPYQLAVARRLGLRIPRTTITSRADDARAFAAAQGALVHKPLTGSNVRMLATRRFDDASIAALDRLALAPEIFQEAVCGGRELRITMVGAKIFAAEFRPGDGIVDGRTDLETSYREHALPAAVVRDLHALMAQLGLVYATIDMKLTEDGDYVFLELNPQGQFLYIELLTGLPIAAAVAELLTTQETHAQAPSPAPATSSTPTAAARQRHRRGRDRIDLDERQPRGR
jgi:glutathione synthase/RimK-type ligase-like ATP-grasp enzyme